MWHCCVGIITAKVYVLHTRSTAAGVVLAALLVSFPETLVRGAHGAYFAATSLLALVILSCLDETAPRRETMLASALAFLVDQKGLLVPAAWALAAPRRAGWSRFLPLAGGLAGAAAFLAWGLAVDPRDLPLRLRPGARDPPPERRRRPLRGRHGSLLPFHPAVVGRVPLARYGAVFTAWAAVAAGVGLRRERPAARAAGAAVLLGALVFSVVDWRQTPHLALLTAPAVVALAGAWPRSAAWRRGALLIAAALILRNLWAARPLLTAFESWVPHAGW